MNQPVKIPKVLYIILILFLMVSMLATVVAIHNPGGRSYPRTIVGPPGPKGDEGVVDYQKLAALIHNEVASLNLKDGTNGVNGLDGKNGNDGKDGQSVTSQQIATAVISYLQANPPAQGFQGNPGDPGANGKSIELRYNTVKSQIEWHYEGDLTWKVLVTACTLTNTCL